ncbi:MAG: phosphoribosylformylglycinamidine cyclo-ligase [Acetivibrionales bacterium]|jgi:phosphoribosylformylglycinamidine cyclo-ligase|nr:phosphoribosylformylglycinamidine cyclo-ligase [Clostridiaceae bacterium]
MANYKDAGVDVEAGYKAVNLMKAHIQKTMRPEVINEIGGFSGAFSLENMNYKEPVLVSGTDGVGTKLKIAFLMDKHDTVGIDCVAMCANDVVCSGAQPLFFLDYIAFGKLIPEKAEQIVKGISEGCVQAGCALIGGETAEMPGFYPVDEYDLAGFVVGIGEKGKLITGAKIKEGDILVGLASSGIHSNGFSLVRKALNISEHNIDLHIESLGKSLGDEILTPTKIYVKTILALTQKYDIKGIAHITGGGFIENIPRMLPDGLKAIIHKGSWEIPPIFKLIQDSGNVPAEEMYNTFNMGIGMVMALPAEIAPFVVAEANNLKEKAYIIGEVTAGEEKIEIC